MKMYKESTLPEGTTPFGNIFKLRIVDQGDNSTKYGDIHLPSESLTNIQLLKAEVVDFDDSFELKYLNRGDVVLYDRYGAYFRPSAEVGTEILTDFINIICKIDDNDELIPFGEYIMIEQVAEKNKKVGGVILSDQANDERECVVLATGQEEGCPVSVGDSVFARSEGSVRISYKSKTILLIPYECVVGKLIK
jgi:co-chaperonin GroES (HSP10)